MDFAYGSTEINYLKSRDPRLAEVIDRIGHIRRETDEDLFSAVVHQIVSQQISTKAQQSIWDKMRSFLGAVTPEAVLACGRDSLQKFGISFRKADYILDFAAKVKDGTFDLNAVASMPDDEAIRALSSLKGIGPWTAEMLLLFCLQRPDVLSFGDMGIQRGLRMVYHHRRITPELFAKYRRRFSPCGSVASLYLWAVAGGAIPEMRDYAPQKAVKK